MRNEEVEIPFFQRPYVWGKEQWEQLFDDLFNAYHEKKEHFLGSIVLKQIQTNVGDGSKRSLIDGQQRITTFSLLVKSLYESVPEEYKIDYMTYLFRTPVAEKKPKIQHSKNDEKIFSEILSSSHLDSLKQYKDNRLVDAYRYFVERIDKEVEDCLDFLKFILNSKLWVTIDLDINEDEQKIFDSINTAGIKLTATDIVKNAIFAKAISLGCNHIELYEKYWENIFENEQSRVFWEQVVASGRIKRVQSEIFLHAFAITQGFFDPEKHSLEKLSGIYKDYFLNFSSVELEGFIKRIYDYAKIYKDFPQVKKETIFSFDDYERRFFHILQQTESNTVLPLVLYLKIHFSSKQEKFRKCLFEIEKFILCNWLCYKTTKDYNKLFAGIIKKLKDSNDFSIIFETLNERMPKQEEIKNALLSKDYVLSNNRARLVLFWIELYRRFKNSKTQDIVELSYIYTLEHLIPQEWEEHWSEICIDDEKAYELIYQIGNMTLLKGSLNSSIKNQKWEIKLRGDGSRRNCLSSCADLLITKEILDWDILNEEKITQRTLCLVKDFFEIWNLQN